MLIFTIVLITALLMILVEIKRPGRKWPQVSGWWARAFLLNAVQVSSVFAGGLLWDRWFLGISMFEGHLLGTTAGAVVGYLVITFIYYWWHRFRHDSQFLWRWFHQVHHSPQRIEIITSFYKHPLEIFINSLLSSAVLYLLLGVTPEAASLAVLLTGLGELFYHWNIDTPYWLGFFFQRPESHCVHHQQGLHKYNYSDLPFWDILFGTFHNPKNFEAECGFASNKELHLKEMLLGRDVSNESNAEMEL